MRNLGRVVRKPFFSETELYFQRVFDDGFNNSNAKNPHPKDSAEYRMFKNGQKWKLTNGKYVEDSEIPKELLG